MIKLLYGLNVVLLLSSFLVFNLSTEQKRYSLGIVQILMFLPLLSGVYIYTSNNLTIETVRLILFSELAFTLLWLSMTMHMKKASNLSQKLSVQKGILEVGFIGIVAVTGYYLLVHFQVILSDDYNYGFSLFDSVFFSALFTLIAMLYGAWQLEAFYRQLNTAQRWEYKFHVIGCYLVSGIIIWNISYRLTYLRIDPKHFLLLSLVIISGWIMMIYAVFHHRLLNRQIFVSRKVVYSFIIPSFLAIYLLGFGAVTFIMRAFGYNMAYVLNWLLVTAGCVLAGIFALSPQWRRRAHFFISTHFYNNKYEYRDEWLSLSQHLQGVTTEIEVVSAMRKVLSESLYTSRIFIWLGDEKRGFRLVETPVNGNRKKEAEYISQQNRLLSYLKKHTYFYTDDTRPDSHWHEIINSEDNFLTPLDLKLLVPLAIGHQVVGLIAIGSEFTGGRYGEDDFDLLSALGGQTASALLAIRTGEELSHVREQQAWHRLSAFVLHDIKNAATMLSLLQNNAPENIHKPEFQQDMLELVNDALKRMNRVENQLRTLNNKIEPKQETFNLNTFLEKSCKVLESKLRGLQVNITSAPDIEVCSDSTLLASILENLSLNSLEAGGGETKITLNTYLDHVLKTVVIEFSDNGPGIHEELLPDGLFEPFRTSKDGGSGIGLWQARQMMLNLDGNIEARNNTHGGALFVLGLPLKTTT